MVSKGWRDNAAERTQNVAVLVPDDPSVQHLDVKIGPYNYHYMLSAPPSGEPVATVLLCHGWPDLGAAWRYQIPFLASLGMRVIAPDMLGYGRTSAPAEVEEYSFKKMAADMKELVEHVCGKGTQVILGGHDWGGFFVWRMAMWHPETVRAVFSLNVPYSPPHTQLLAGEELVRRVPSFRYQLQLASPVAEEAVDASPQRLRSFLKAMYGGVGPNGERGFSVGKGVLIENLDKIGDPPLLSPEWLEFYFREYSRHGMHGPTNWYRTRKVNFEEELEFTKISGGFKLKQPAMVVMGEFDFALPPAMADGTERFFDGPVPLRKKLAHKAGHWAMWQVPDQINVYIAEFLREVLGDRVLGKL